MIGLFKKDKVVHINSYNWKKQELRILDKHVFIPSVIYCEHILKKNLKFKIKKDKILSKNIEIYCYILDKANNRKQFQEIFLRNKLNLKYERKKIQDENYIQLIYSNRNIS